MKISITFFSSVKANLSLKLRCFETEEASTLPMNEEALIQLVPNIDSNVVVCSNIDNRTWELVVDSNDLQQKTMQRQDMKAIT